VSGRYSAFALLKQGLGGHEGWPQAWRKAKPKPAYDFVIVGGGGLDCIPSFSRRRPPVQEIVVSGLLDTFPAFGQLKLVRQWGGVVDVILVTGAHHEISRPFDLSRFAAGRLIGEAAGSVIAH
jgi:hypothetical protein